MATSKKNCIATLEGLKKIKRCMDAEALLPQVASEPRSCRS
jgi:hypothetical protein